MPPQTNIYATEIDFARLAVSSAAFRQYLKPNGQLDFSDPAAVQQLTKSLLERDFALKLELPDDRLCPPVPNRLNYIAWIHGLIDTTGPKFRDEYDQRREVLGLDIGTGSSCIYPLLGCVLRPNWKFIATEVDEKNLQYARRNVLYNHLKDRIRPLASTTDGPLLPLDEMEIDNIDFTMCNPPFYTAVSEMLASATAKSRPPFSACTGAEIEMVTPGGEVAFVKRMISESKILRDRVQWYTSMLGKLSSVGALTEELLSVGIKNWALCEFVQGGKTRRWGIAWSWQGYRPNVLYARGINSVPKHILPFPSEQSFIVPNEGRDTVAQRANEELAQLDLRWRYRQELHQGVGVAVKNVWSRAARRERQRATSSEADVESHKHSEESEAEEPALAFKLSFESNAGGSGTTVLIRWLVGQDTVIFESFCGMMRRMMLLRAG